MAKARNLGGTSGSNDLREKQIKCLEGDDMERLTKKNGDGNYHYIYQSEV